MFDNEKNKYVRLESKVYLKYLGVLIDQNLSWKYHIDSIVTKICKNVGLIDLFTDTAAILNKFDLRSIIGCPGGMSTFRLYFRAL